MRTFRLAQALRQAGRTGLIGLCLLWAGQSMTGIAQSNNLAARLNKTFSDAHQRFLAEPNDPEVAWKLSRACFDVADIAPNNTQRAEFANQGIAAARQSLAENNNSAAAHYYLGMNIAQLADTKHNLSGLRMVKDMEREFLAACALDEHFDQAGADRNLGLLYREAPVIASIGSRSKARQHLERAVALAPDFPENGLNLIEAYLKWDYHTEALRELQNLEKIWPEAQKKFTGDEWASTWADWNKRLNVVKKKLDDTTKIIASPHSAP